MGLYGGVCCFDPRKKIKQEELKMMALSFPRKSTVTNYFLNDNIGAFDILDEPEIDKEICNDHKKLILCNADFYTKIKDPQQSKINGIYTIFMLDKDKHQIEIRTDHSGKKVLYYYICENALYFCSFLNGLLAIPFFQKEINKKALNSYLYLGSNITEETFFKGIKKLNKGKKLALKNEKVSIVQEPPPFEHIELPMNFELRKDLLKKSFIKTTCNLVKNNIGVPISGGIDSSAIIISVKDKILSNNISSFSFEAPPYTEKEFIDELLKKYPIKHEICKASLIEFLSSANIYIKNLCEPPSDDTFALGTFIFANKIKESCKEIMVGEAADTILGGLPRIFNHYKSFSAEETSYNKACHFSELFILLEDLIRVIIIDKEMQNYGKAQIVELFEELFENTRYSKTYKEQIFEVSKWFYLHEDMPLKFIGIQARYPFLDIKLNELIYNLPYDDKIKNGGQTSGDFKYILRKAFEHDFPIKILTREKAPFTIPLLDWGVDFIQGIREIVMQDLDIGIFNQKAIDQIFKSLLEHKRNVQFLLLLWRIYNIKTWINNFINSKN